MITNIKENKLGPSSFIQNEGVLNIIHKRLTIRDKEKDEYGEVFTPIELICEMLNMLPKDVWTDPDLKWLDPANGIGNFPIIVYYKLMESLKDYKPKGKTLSQHIIEDMLYMVELNQANVRECKKIFHMVDPDAKLSHIANHDFLTFNPQKEWNIDKFDVIMGNPPFHTIAGPIKRKRIWHRFVIECVTNKLNKDKYLLFIHPNGWRNVGGDYKKVFSIIQERDLQRLHMRDYNDNKKIFGGIATNYDYYCLKNTMNNNNKTIINDIDRNEVKIDLNNYLFIPSGMFEMYDKLTKDEEKVKIIYSSNAYETRAVKSKNPINKDKTTTFIWPVVNSITQKGGIKRIWSSVKSKDMFVPKVIWSDGVGTYPILDKEGEYGLTQFSYGIQDEPKYLNDIKQAMEDPEFIELMKYVKFTNHKYNYRIIGTFKKDFYKHFKGKTMQTGKEGKKKV